MKFDRFAPDYGILPLEYFAKSAITNPTELFWSDDLLALLRLCGEREELIGERASDYDRYASLCRALSLLDGHPTRAWIASVLEKHFHLKEIPTEETAASVWKTLCESLLQDPISPCDLVSGSWLCDSLTVPNGLPKHITPVLDANLLLNTTAKNASAWSEEITKTASHFAAHRCQKIVLHLPAFFDFTAPSRYHIDRALSMTKRDRETTNLLTCQLVRELCAVAQAHELLLVLVCEGHPSTLARLLEYAEANVGLPCLCWSVREAREAHALLEFSSWAHKHPISAALPYHTVMTQAELLAATEAYRVRYPIGKLCFVTARDLRQTSFAQAHIADMLQKTKAKI